MSRVEAHLPPPLTAERDGSGLRVRALGFPTLLAQGVAAISPTMTAVLIIPLAFADAGQGTWLSYVFGTIMLLFTVLCLNQFAKRSALAGSMYGYTAKGLGPKMGVLSGWTLIWSYLFIATAGLTGFSIFAQQLLTSMGVGHVPPVLLFCVSAAICWLVAYKDIRISSLLTLLFEGASCACIIALAFIVLFKHGFPTDTVQFEVKGMGLHGLSLAVVISIFSLVGFESATALGSEAKKPLQSVPRAVIWSLLLTGAFMVFMSYVEVFATRHASVSLATLSAPLTFISKAYGVSFFKIPVAIGAMVSFFSLSLSCLNAGSRIIYPMAHHMVFPRHLGRSHRTNRTPHIAITAYILVILSVPSILSAFTDPLTIFGYAGTLAAFGFLTAYFLISIAAPFYLKKCGELRPRHIVLATLAVLFLLVPAEGSFYPVPPFPVNLFPYIFLGYVVLGASWLFFVSRRQPNMFANIEAEIERSMIQSAESHAQEISESTVPVNAQLSPVTAESAVVAEG